LDQGWRYVTVRSNFKPKVRYVGTVRFKKYTSVRYVGTVRLTLRSMHVFIPKKGGTAREVRGEVRIRFLKFSVKGMYGT